MPSIIVRKSADRGHADHGWLNTHHTFSFANYYDPSFNGFGPLRVINEDFVSGGNGFGLHPHRNYEIFSYVVSGEIRHSDSMGNVEVVGSGDVQFTSAGSGIFHSEYNNSARDQLHFLQCWVKPAKQNLEPSYAQASFPREKKLAQLCPIVSGSGKDGAVRIHQDTEVLASILRPGDHVSYDIRPGRGLYIHTVMTGGPCRVSLDDEQADFSPGDGAFVVAPGKLTIAHPEGGAAETELLLFDAPHVND